MKEPSLSRSMRRSTRWTNRALSAAARTTFEKRFELGARVAQIADWLEQRADGSATR